MAETGQSAHMFVDALQYVRPSRQVFEQMNQGQMGLVHITVGYHETFDGVLRNLAAWNQEFESHGDLITPAHSMQDVRDAQRAGKTAIMFGLQNPLAISADISRIAILHQLGIRFCQVTYNQQSLLGAGCFEDIDSGLTAFGRECVTEMNRLGMVIDLSHAGSKTAQDVAEFSDRPVAVTHANPHVWHAAPRNISETLIETVTGKGGMVGFSLYPHHLNSGSECAGSDFAAMAADCVHRFGPHFGIGSDLCQDQPDSVVNWMRNGHWRKTPVPAAVFPTQPSWFSDNRDFPGLAPLLHDAGLSQVETDGVLGQNWITFLDTALRPL
ncbi:MAG: membrane dipeptidase [Pseudomonadota bacterium]